MGRTESRSHRTSDFGCAAGQRPERNICRGQKALEVKGFQVAACGVSRIDDPFNLGLYRRSGTGSGAGNDGHGDGHCDARCEPDCGIRHGFDLDVDIDVRCGPGPATAARAGANPGTASTGAPASTLASPSSGMSPSLVAPRVDPSPQSLGQVCYVPRRVSTFQEEALIVPGPATQRWNAGRVLYGVGTGLSMASLMLSSIGGIYAATGSSTASLSDPAAAISLAGNVGNLTGTALLVGGLAAQHSALGMLGKDSGRGKFIAGVVFGALGLASVGTGYILGGVDIPNKDVLNYAIGYGGTLLLTTASGILINDAKKLRQIWDTLGMKPGVPTYPMPPQQPFPYPQQQPGPYPQQPGPYPQQPAPYPQQQPGFPPPG